MKSSPNEPSFNTPNSLLGISVSLWNEIFFNQLMKRLKEEDYQGKIVLGGSVFASFPILLFPRHLFSLFSFLS